MTAEHCVFGTKPTVPGTMRDGTLRAVHCTAHTCQLTQWGWDCPGAMENPGPSQEDRELYEDRVVVR